MVGSELQSIKIFKFMIFYVIIYDMFTVQRNAETL